MRRQGNSLVSHAEKDAPLIHDDSQKADKMANVLDTTLVNCEKFTELGAFGNDLPASIMPELKLDAILANVASRLPSIDLDISDVSFADYSSYSVTLLI